MFDPNERPTQCEHYLSRFLGAPVKLIGATQLTQSSRAAPWRLDVAINGLEKAYVLQLDARGLEYEYRVLKAMEATPIPTPHPYGLDLHGEALGVPCFFSEFIEGESLLAPMLAGETWAEAIYLDAVCALQALTATELGEAAQHIEQETAEDVLEDAYAHFQANPHPLAEAMYRTLKSAAPAFPAPRFSNGDLWLDNFLVQDQKLAAVIDFQGAAFSDPIYEFLLSFFVAPALRRRGIEERYCQHIGVDPAILHWYHGLEFFDIWRWVLRTGKDFVGHTAESLETKIQRWLGGDEPPH
jgi:aminoglycoside phosphotransferase (APT) family kinase protein